jgi:ABC-type sugar transport system substrate-binding protein
MNPSPGLPIVFPISYIILYVLTIAPLASMSQVDILRTNPIRSNKGSNMKKSTLSIQAIFILFSIFFTSCGAQATSDIAATQAQPLVETQAPPPVTEPEFTKTPVPTATPAPTEVPPPLPCNITFDTDRDGNREIYVMGPDGKGTTNLTNNPADDWDPFWSPDGTQIAFVSNRENGQEGGQFIYVMKADGSDVRQLTTENGSDWPNWSHDGSKITYSSMDDIYVIDANGSGQSVNLTNSPEKDSQSSWSPDGSQIVWLSGSDKKWNIFVMNADGSNVRRLTDDGNVSDVQWTVDGQLFTHWKNQTKNCFNCVMDADGSNIMDAGGKGDIQRYLPFWTVDGNRVELANVDQISGNEEIYLVGKIFPDIFFNLTNNPAADRNPSWPANCGPGSEKSTAEILAVKGSTPEAQQIDDTSAIVIGYAGDDPSQQQRKVDFQKACDELGIRCVYGKIPGLIDQGVDAIVQNANNRTVQGLHQDILNARDKGIPVFVLDAEPITDGAYSITIDHSAWAKTGLGWMFEKMGGTGDFAYFDFQPFDGYATVIGDMLEKYSGVKVVVKRDGKFDYSQIKVDVNQIMQANPGLKAIWSNGLMSDVVFGVADTGLPSEKWPLLMCDATKEGLFIWKDLLKANPGMKCMALGNPPGIAYDAVYAAYYLETGSKIDESVLSGPFGHSLYVHFPEITNDNLPEWLDRINYEDAKYVVDELMKPEEIKEKWFLE